MVPLATVVATSASSAAPAAGGKSLVEQLRELREALNEKLISQEEHDASKKAILAKMHSELAI